MKEKVALATIVLLAAQAPIALGAQLDAVIRQDSQQIEPTFEYFRIIYIDYPNGGKLADLLRGETKVVSFLADSQTDGIVSLVDKLNQYLRSKDSTSTVTDVKVKYKAELVGNQNSASIQYNVKMIPTISNAVIRDAYFGDSQNNERPRLVDSTWRGLSVYGEIPLQTSDGKFDMNNPASALKVLHPQAYEEIAKTDATTILNRDLLIAEGIFAMPLDKWHSLFDPTPLQSETKKIGFSGGDVVLTRYSLGECNIETGPCKDISLKQDFTIDEKQYAIRLIESQDDATITIEGYVSTTDLAGLEVFGISKEKSNGVVGEPGTGGFPVSVIYGMAGIAAIGAGVFFWISNHKLKSEVGAGQR
nr:hypothetical protein [Candidatus Korarchaeota archaeon]